MKQSSGVQLKDRKLYKLACAAFRAGPTPKEALAVAVFSAAFVFILASGDNNGVGYFSSAETDLVLPLALSTIVHLAFAAFVIFFVLQPDRRFHQPLLTIGFAVIGLLGCAAMTTAVQKIVIVLRDEYLRSVTWTALFEENVYFALVVLVLAVLYRAIRDAFLRPPPLPSFADHKIVLGTRARPVLFSASDIVFIRSEGNYLEVVTESGSQLVYGALKSATENLPETNFAQIHRSYVLNLDYARSIGPNKALLKGTERQELPIGASFREQLSERWKAAHSS